MNFQIDTGSKDPLYKQLIAKVEKGIRDGSMPPGMQLASMNELAAELDISRETVKKAYGILAAHGLILPRHGKGFYVADPEARARLEVLVIIDKFSVYKQILLNAFYETLEDRAEITTLNHNQNLDLLEYYLDNELDQYDYYVLAPHFPLDEASQSRCRKLLRRIPFRKLILLDHLQPGFPGNFGAVYQDFENDIYSGLMQGVTGSVPRTRMLRVITLPSSLYGRQIRKGVERFVQEQDLPVEYLTEAPDDIRPGDTFLVLNSQLDAGLVSLARKIQVAGLTIGKDVFIISYNEFDMNELVLGGLTTVSTDFREMGRIAAQMILDNKIRKEHCPFRMIRRSTF